MEDLAVSLERLAYTLDGQAFSPGAARLVQVNIRPVLLVPWNPAQVADVMVAGVEFQHQLCHDSNN